MKVLFLSTSEIETTPLLKFAQENDCTLEFFVSENEGKMIDKIHSAHKIFNYIILNTNAYKGSYAIADAIKSVDIPLIEVSNEKSVLSSISVATFHGKDDSLYLLALKGALHHE